MVLIKNLTQSQVNGISENFRGEVITNADTNKLMFNDGTKFTYLVYSDLNNVVSGLAGLSATNLTGTIQTAAQPNITSLGNLNSLVVNNNLSVPDHNGVDTGLTLNGDLVTSSAEQLNYVNTTPGTAEAGKALVTDSNNAIIGLSNLETDNLTVNGTLVTSSAIELNYVDVDTLGVAQASKALVVDADRNITNINTLEADFIQVNGTLVTSSAIELNYVDVETLGTAQASKALVVDANRNIGNLNNVSAVNLTGTLQTAAQPNITSVGTLNGLNVTGVTNLESLVVNGVPLDTFKEGGLKMRVYSTPDFNGRVVKADVITQVNFNDYEPVAGLTENYSMEIWGYIKPQYTESYTFNVTSNDKFRLWINNQLVRYDWSDGQDTDLQTSPIPLTAGVWYPIYIQHSQLTGTEALSLRWTSTSQVSEIISTTDFAYDDKIVNVVARETYTMDSIKLYDGLNSNISSVSTNASGDLNLTAASNFVNVTGHNGSTLGLKLGNVLVTATASELNYVDTTVGTAAGTKAVILNADKDYAGLRNLTTTGNMGINTSAPSKQLEINSSTGDVLRMTYDDADGSAVNYADMTISSDGKLTINSSGNETIIHSSDNFNVAGHDGSTIGLKLANVLVTATAEELNYVDTTPGAAEASKALIVDASRNINNINDLTSSSFTSLSTDNSTSVSTGAIKTAGGVGIAKNLNVGGVAKVLDTTDSTLTTDGALTVAGGVGIAKTVNVGEHLNVTGNTDLTGSLDVDGLVNLNNVTDSTSSSTGALVIDGGVGIAKSVNVGETLTVTGNTTLSADVVVDGPSLRVPVGDTAARPVGVLGQVRYNSETSQFEGFGAGNSWGSLGGVTDVDQDTKITAETAAGDDNDELRFYNAGSETMRLTNVGLMGLGTINPSKKLEINSATGDVLRMTYNDADGSAVNYADMTISSDGKLTINSSGNETLIHSSDNFNVVGHDGSTLGLKLANVLVTATATELNYVDTTPGTAEASKALVLNSSRNIANINNLSMTGDAVVTGTAKTAGLVLSSSETGSFDANAFNTVTSTVSSSIMTGYDVGLNKGVTDEGAAVSIVNDVLTVGSLTNSAGFTSYMSSNGISGYVGGVGTGGMACIAPDGTVFVAARFNGSGTYAPVIIKVVNGVRTQALANPALSANGNRFYTVAAKSANELIYYDPAVNKVYYSSNGSTFTQSTSGPAGITNISGTFEYVSQKGLYIYGTGSGIWTSPTGETWTPATTPGGGRTNIYFNESLGKAFAYSVGGNTLWQSTNLLSWTAVTLPALGGMTFGEGLNNRYNGVFAIYPNAPNTSKNMLYTLDGITWQTTLLTLANNEIPGVGWLFLRYNVQVFNNNKAYYIALNSGFKLYNTAAVNAVASLFKLNYLTGGYLANQSKTGYQWYSSSTDSSVGNKIMELDSELSMTVSQSLENTTDSSSTTTGALKVAGGVGIAKSVNIGQNLNVDGNVDVDGPSLRIPVGNTLARPVGQLGQIRYNNETSQFEGFGAGNTWGSLGGVTDVDQDTKILAETAAGADNDELRFYNAGNETMRLTSTGSLGLGTTSPDKKLEINSATGDVLRLAHNDTDGSAVNYVDMTVSESGNLTINSSGNETIIHSSDSLNVAGHNGSTLGLKLAGVLVTATATELNYLDTTPGTVEASKAMVVDASRNISNVNAFSTSTLAAISTAESTSISTGAITTAGGVGIAKNLNVGGIQTITNVTNSTSSSNGALVVSGGAGIKKALFVGEEGSSVTTTTGGVQLGDNWTDISPSNVSKTDNVFLGVTWSGTANRFVAVGSSMEGNNIIHSADGSSWSKVGVGKQVDDYNTLKGTAYASSNESAMWSSVAYNGSVYVAVGGIGANVMTSTNGTTWTNGTINGACADICWSDELSLFVAVGNNRILTSPNGTTWTARATPATGGWNSVCWSSDLGLFVAVSTYDAIITSPDAITWTARTTPAARGWSSVCWAGGSIQKFIAVAMDFTNSGSNLITSSNGITWTVATTGNIFGYRSVCWSYDLDKIVAFTDSNVLTSTNGTSWTTITGVSGYQDVTWCGSLSRYVAVKGSQIASSVDGNTWLTFTNGVSSNDWKGVVEGSFGTLIAVSTNGTNRVLKITTGTSTDVAQSEMFDVTYASGMSKYVAIGRYSYGPPDNFFHSATSTNGVSWTYHENATTVDAGTSALYYNINNLQMAYSSTLNKLVVVGTNVILTSTNGTTWTEQRVSAKPYTNVIWAAGSINKFVAIGEGGLYSTSSDGETWTHNYHSSEDLFESIAYSPTLNKFIIKGLSGSYTSSNAVTFTLMRGPGNTPVANLDFATWKELQWVDETSQFVAVGYAHSKSLITSSDGVTWTSFNGIPNVEYEDFVYSPELDKLLAITSHNDTIKVVQSTYSAGVTTTTTVPADGYFNLKGDADITGGIDVEGIVNMNNTTQSTSPSNGALVVDGGVGIAKNLNVGQSLDVDGDATLSANVTVDGPSLRIPVGNTAARPVGVLGQIRYNNQTSQFEGFGAGNSWGSLGGVTDVDQDTRISAETSAGADNDELRFYNAGSETMRLTNTGLLGLGTTTPSKKLEINSATGDVLRLTYNDNDGAAVNYVDMNVSADGKLTINSSGNETLIHSSDNFNVAGHDGATIGLKLAGVLVTSTATELNYVDTTPGTAEASKALVLNSSRDISNINVLAADTVNVNTFSAQDLSAENITTTGNVGINTSDLTFGLQINHSTGNVLRLTYNDNSGSSPASKAEFTMDGSNNLSISASNSVNIVTHNGTDKGLKLAGVLVTSTATELNYVDTTPGAAEASKALVLNSSKDITGINSMSMNVLNLTHDSAVVDTTGRPLVITRTTTGTPANGLGVGMSFKIENSANSNIEFGNINIESSDITAASEDGQFVVNLMTNGTLTEALRLSSTYLYTNELYETSDVRVKENITLASLEETHSRVMSLRLVDYNYIWDNKTHRGLLAQEVEQVIPVAVETENRNGIEDFKSVSNREVTNHLVGSVQYLSAKLEETMSKLANLMEEFEAYKQSHP